MFNKKGISPIIATMLLVAFAVAVGASFVSFAGIYFEAKSLNKTVDCKDYAMGFFELDKTKNFCLSEPLVLKFGQKNIAPQTECYVSVASGTGRLCNAESVAGKAWVPSDVKI